MRPAISKSNALIEASYRLSLTEIQIILYGISLINPTSNDFPLEYRIDIKRFAELFGRVHGEIYNDIKDAIKKRFWERDFTYLNEQGRSVTCRWLTRITNEDKTGHIEIKFSEDVQPYLHQLKKNYTCYYIEQISQFKSIYSVRIYEFCLMELNKSRLDKQVFTLEVVELKRRLQLVDKYKRFSNFKDRILEKSRSEINKHSDIILNYSVIKQGRTPKKVKFIVTRKSKSEEKTVESSTPLGNDYLLPCSSSQTSMKPKILTPSVFEKAKKIITEAGDQWDLYAIEQQFYEYVKKKGPPESLEGAFLGFVRKKVQSSP